MSRNGKSEIGKAMAQIPGGLFVMTSACEGHAGAVLVKWVQPCSDSPPMVMVAIKRGQHIEPLLRNSRCFVLCQISESDRFLLRKFGQTATPAPAAEAASDRNGFIGREEEFPHEDDPLVTMPTTPAPSGSPIVERAMAYLDCEIIRHVELESDYRIYVGQVHAGGVLNQGAPAIQFGGNGSRPCT